MKLKSLFSIFFIGALTTQPVFADIPINPSSSLSGEDIPERDYYQKVRQMIQLSTTSIDLSIAEMAVGDQNRDSVWLLIQDLITAQKRGAKVRMFLNTYPEEFDTALFLREDLLYSLRREGVEVHFINPKYRMHDRVLIFDGEWVVEGGLPWTHEDLEKGLGSATLVRSTQIAEKKRIRLELLPLWDVERLKMERTDGRIAVPLFLLREEKYFPSMIQMDDPDSMKIYLALLRNFYQLHQMQMNVSLEELSREIPADRFFEKDAVMFQVFKSLQRLETQYELIKVEKKESERVHLSLILPPDLEKNVGVPPAFFHENYCKESSASAIYVYLVILHRSQTSGEAPVWLGSSTNIEKDFPLGPENFKVGIDELRRENLIELFPFQLNPSQEPRTLKTLEYRYLINPLLALSEKLDNWSRLRDLYGDDKFKTGRQLAEALGEPEDPKVIATYLELLDHYPFEDVLSVTQRFSTLPPQSTPQELHYIQEVLKHESAPHQLAT
jgi:hypothetical protein